MPIPRRSFLKSAAAAFPVAAMQDLLPQADHAPQQTGLHVVGNGEDRFGELRPMGFSKMLFKVGASESNGGLFVIENSNLTPNAGPPLHLHFDQEEMFYVHEGRVALQVGERKFELNPGESVLAPRQIPHTWSAVIQGSRMLGAFAPAGMMEQFFRGIVGHPALQADAEFVSRFGMKLIGPSPFAKRAG